MTDTPQSQNPPAPAPSTSVEKASARRRTKSVVRASRREARVLDGFVNEPSRIGQGTDNQSTFGTYGFNPITRLRIVLDYAYRGSWICRTAVEAIPEDMFREGLDFGSEISPDDRQILYTAYNKKFGIASKLAEAMQWGRLYGGSIAVIMIDGQRPETPLRLETVGPGQFCGLQVFDRWMLMPALNDLVTDIRAPDLGKPKFYSVVADAPVFARQRIHHTRVVRFDGVTLPCYQRIAENLWSMSVLEPVFDRIKAFDAATLGTAQLVYRAHMRTLYMEKWKEAIAAGGVRYEAAVAMIHEMRRWQGNESITVLDATDKFESTQYSFTGLDSVLIQMGQQISGALAIPLVRLFGQSPAGLNSTGESDWRMYYDGLRSRQETDLRPPLEVILRVMARSEKVELPPGFNFSFKPLWQLTTEVKTSVAAQKTATVQGAVESGLVSRATALKELKQASEETGVWTNITEEDIEEAKLEPPMPGLGQPGLEPPVPASSSLGSEAPIAESREDEPPDELPSRRSFLPGRPRLRTIMGGNASPVGARYDGEDESDSNAMPAGYARAIHLHRDGTTRDKDNPGRATRFAGHDVIVEVEAGWPRRQGSSDGAILKAPYGYFPGTKGLDGDAVDVFLGPYPEAEKAYVITQQDADTQKVHQHKVFLGYEDPAMVTDHFIAFYADGRGTERLRSGQVMSRDEFDRWLSRYRVRAA